MEVEAAYQQLEQLVEQAFLKDPALRKQQPGEVLPGKLWLCAGTDLLGLEFLEEVGITAILNCAGAASPTVALFESGMVKHYKSLEAQDDEDYDLLANHYDEAEAFLDAMLVEAEGERVAIHCVAGINRSATLLVAYLMKNRQLDLWEAVERVTSQRHVILLNTGFQRQLVRFAAKLGRLAPPPSPSV
eukprot:TRINITY_DN67176_c10_g7_i1.p2 TRINITY_DN67176_c10_g7~~TRINITY_DN67176_c10_g7_i1.p2  ORF type:complete len:188 (-),score=37.88 TRINITY_DN67176_c10_g7_i1:806-1369(-)